MHSCKGVEVFSRKFTFVTRRGKIMPREVIGRGGADSKEFTLLRNMCINI